LGEFLGSFFGEPIRLGGFLRLFGDFVLRGGGAFECFRSASEFTYFDSELTTHRVRLLRLHFSARPLSGFRRGFRSGFAQGGCVRGGVLERLLGIGHGCLRGSEARLSWAGELCIRSNFVQLLRGSLFGLRGGWLLFLGGSFGLLGFL